MRVGDKVTWESQAGGKVRQKTGVVEFVVPAYKSVWEVMRNFSRRPWPWRPMFDTVMRDHESYLVAVESGGKSKPKLYWPIVSALKLVDE